MSLRKLKDPKYTGDNRCIPCTLVNATISIGIGLLLSIEAWWLGFLFVICSAGVIWLRGYLVPKTPELTKRYLPKQVQLWFKKETEEVLPTGQGAFDDSKEEVEVESLLFQAGVIEPCTDRNDLCLTDKAQKRWKQKISSVSKFADVEPHVLTGYPDAEHDMSQIGDSVVIRLNSNLVGRWPSRDALLADITGATMLKEYSSYWDELTISQRGQLLTGLRLFTPACPSTGGRVDMKTETVESCCSSNEIAVLICADSGQRLLERTIS